MPKPKKVTDASAPIVRAHQDNGSVLWLSTPPPSTGLSTLMGLADDIGCRYVGLMADGYRNGPISFVGRLEVSAALRGMSLAMHIVPVRDGGGWAYDPRELHLLLGFYGHGYEYWDGLEVWHEGLVGQAAADAVTCAVARAGMPHWRRMKHMPRIGGSAPPMLEWLRTEHQMLDHAHGRPWIESYTRMLDCARQCPPHCYPSVGWVQWDGEIDPQELIHAFREAAMIGASVQLVVRWAQVEELGRARYENQIAECRRIERARMST